ncbi:poly(U)-specific endoribonuclease homolog [Copidosoma floridanum]|uniref:poly(U)-specific endoribonuclease homolog n=1 Tax=Copidosoma floridanum TaxID=29053 RepID=UPI0006C952B2|nr:poly(U)-specific endoribonuclease homolog [Copidosoma floridanum]
MNFLAGKGFLKKDINEYKKSLHKLWFEPNAKAGDYSVVGTSGFEVVFITEKDDAPYNWIHASQMEEQNKNLQLQNLKWNTVLETAHGFKVTLVGFDSMVFGSREISDVYLLVGTSPELEMAIYTVCFYVRPNSDCSVSFGKVNLTIHIS